MHCTIDIHVLSGSQEFNVVLFHLPAVIMLLKRTHRRDGKQSWVLENTWCLQRRRVSMRKEPPVSLTKLNTAKSVAQLWDWNNWNVRGLGDCVFFCASWLVPFMAVISRSFWLCLPLCNYQLWNEYAPYIKIYTRLYIKPRHFLNYNLIFTQW